MRYQSEFSSAAFIPFFCIVYNRKGLQEGKYAAADRICSVLDSDRNGDYVVSAQQAVRIDYNISSFAAGI